MRALSTRLYSSALAWTPVSVLLKSQFLRPITNGFIARSARLLCKRRYPRQNGLAKALREIGRIERTLFMLDWFRDPALRRRVQAGLNKGEARNALARAVFMHRLGEIRDGKPENQSYRASGLTLLTAAISLWSTVYMERAIDALKCKGLKINQQLLSHLSPLGWEHINLTGDYIWKSNRILASGKFRRLRPAKVERSKNNLNEWKGLPLVVCLINTCAIMGKTYPGGICYDHRHTRY